MELITRGVANRHVRETHMNMKSSRSHSVFTMRVECRATDRNSDVSALRFGTLHFVDLAGSERTKEPGASGAAMREAQHINRSLSTLRRIILQVQAHTHVRGVGHCWPRPFLDWLVFVVRSFVVFRHSLDHRFAFFFCC